MEPNEPEEKCSNTKTGEETITLQKTRSKSRRVSFAETTAIHLFIRDEEYETPPEVQDSSNGKLYRTESDEIRDLLSSDSDDSDNAAAGDDDDDGNSVKTSFIKHLESPSPGSNFGSATSIDEENCFGPVSAEFIKPGRLSDSAASDENHDITMDSTAFSMHFRSLAKSDSGGEFKTPNRVSLEFGEGTSGQVSTTTNGGDPMVLTASRKRAPAYLMANTINDSGTSDDMIVVGENPRKYDYGELPPDLSVLLAEVDRDVGDLPKVTNAEYSNNIHSLKLDAGSGLHQNRSGLLDSNNNNVDDDHVSNMKKATDGAFYAVFDNNSDSVPHATLGGAINNTSNMYDDCFQVILSDDQTKTPVLPKNGMPADRDEDLRKGFMEVSGKFLSSTSSLQPNLSHEQPIAGSDSSLLGKHRQTFRGLPSVKSNLFVAERKFSEKEGKHTFSTSSFEKGVSRLKKLDFFSFSSASKAEGNASRVIPPESLNNSLTRINLSRYVDKDTSTSLLAAPVTCLDTHFSEVAQDDGKLDRRENIGRYNLRRSGDAQYLIQTEVKDAELFSPSAASCNDKSTKFTGSNVSPFAFSKDKSLEPFVSRGCHTKENVLSTESDCSLLEIAHDDAKYNRETRMPIDSISLDTNAEREVSASPLSQDSLSNNCNLLTDCHLRLERDVKQKISDNFASRSESTVFLHSEIKEEAKWCFSDIEHSKVVIHEMQIDGSMLKKADKASESFKVISSANADNRTMLSKALPVKTTKSVAGSAPTSKDDPNKVPTEVFESSKEDLSCSLLQKKACFTDNTNVHCIVGSAVLTPRSNQLTNKHNENDQCLLKTSNLCGDDRSSSLKRKLFNKADDPNNEFTSFQRKSKSCKDQKYCEGDSKVPHGVGGDASERDWVDVNQIFTSFCGMSKLLTSSLIDKLNFAQVKVLNDIMAHLDKMRSYELLHHGIWSQKSFDSASFLQVKRLVDTKLLLYRTVYQQVKLQLMHLERDKLLDHVRQLDVKVEESKVLLSSCHDPYTRSLAKVDCLPTVNPSKTSSVAAEIPLLQKELEVSYDQIRNLKNSFDAYIMVPKELTCTETSIHVKNFLRKRVACQSVQSECQLCQVESVKAMDGKPSILFDHGGIIFQRFIVMSNSTYGLSISNSINTEKIYKMFPALDACTAFSFASCGQSNLVCSGFRTIAQEIQKTTSLLHSVLDVVEEVELAMLELRNLTDSSFLQPSAGILDLQLCFTDFKSGATVSLSIDISSLNRGIYPSHVLPHEVQGRMASRHEAFQSLLDNIKNAVRSVRCGYMRIISLCRCVSRIVQVYSMS